MSNARLSILQAKAVKDKRVSDSQFRTLAALGMYGDENGWCFPSLGTIGKDLGKSKQAVGRDTIALRGFGYLEVYHRYDKTTGGRRSNLYRLRYDFPIQPDVDGVSTSDVDAPSTSDVDVNVPSNVPSNALANSKIKMPLEWKLSHGEEVTQHDLDEAKIKDEAPKLFEKALGFGTLPWSSNSTWEKFQKFITRIFSADHDVFKDYALWREGDGKYKAFSNRKIRENPAAFMDTGYPEFEASKMYSLSKPAINEANIEATKRLIERKEFTPSSHGIPVDLTASVKQSLAQAAQKRKVKS